MKPQYATLGRTARKSKEINQVKEKNLEQGEIKGDKGD